MTDRHPSQTVGETGARHVRRPAWISLLLVFLVALGVRGGFGAYQLSRAADPGALEFPDEQQYWSMADAYRRGEGLRDELSFVATRMPLFPVLLAPLTDMPRGMILAKASLWIVGAIGAALAAGLAGSMFDRRVGLLAGLLVAFDPFLSFFSSLVLTETPYVTVLLALWWIAWPLFRLPSGAWWTGRWVAVGLCGALSIYVRESGAGLLLALLVALVIVRRFDRKSLIGGIVAGLIVVVALTPWAARNARVTGSWCWLTTRGGISLYDGVGPQATGASDLADVKQMPAVRGLGEADWHRYFVEESLRTMRADPWRIVRLAGVKLSRMWNPVPNTDAYQSGKVRAVATMWSVPTFALAFGGTVLLFRRRKSSGAGCLVLLLLPVVYFSIVHSIFVGSLRYRLPAMPMIAILAAVALKAILDRFQTARERPSPARPDSE